jgi:hypothetical protein
MSLWHDSLLDLNKQNVCETSDTIRFCRLFRPGVKVCVNIVCGYWQGICSYMNVFVLRIAVCQAHEHYEDC